MVDCRQQIRLGIVSKQTAIWQAYADTGALEVSCPNCDAAPDQWCTRPDGRVRRVPCIDRTTTTGVLTTPKYGRDFSEPTHPQID